MKSINLLASFLAAVSISVSAQSASPPASVAYFMGQSNEVSHGTLDSTFPFSGIPGGTDSAGINASALCYETTTTPVGATVGSGTLICKAPTSGVIYAGQRVAGTDVPTNQVVSSANNLGNFPGVTGTGTNDGGTYVVTPSATIGSASSPVEMTFVQPDIGGSGIANANCQIWVPNKKTGSGIWQAYMPKVNSAYNGSVQVASWGPEGPFCQQWSADNPGQTLYMIKIAIGASSLCQLPNGNNYSPEFTGTTGIDSYALLHSTSVAALNALNTQLGITSYSVKVFQWGQGEQDAGNRNAPCGSPFPPFSVSTTPVPYQDNLIDLINRLAIPTPVVATFNGSITNTVLSVTSVTTGSLHQYQAVTGPGVAAGTYIDKQLSGNPSGTGTYSLKVYQATSVETISNGTTSCSKASISGIYFYAIPSSYTSKEVTKSCVTGGNFAVGDVLQGVNVLPNTVITSLDSLGHTQDGLYVVSVNQNVPAETMTASLAGFGTGSDTAKFVMFRTFSNSSTLPTGVQLGQNYINDNAVTAIPATTINTNDALKATPTEIHYSAAWITELGRRLYQAFIGKCDYHSPTC